VRRDELPEQVLVDICFQLVATAKMNDKWFKKATREELMAWVADQLRQCGFPTTPMGASWGVLQREAPQSPPVEGIEIYMPRRGE
jgi:hypothetical protein